MINELYELAQAMRKYHISENIFAMSYNDLGGQDCICVCMSGGSISRVSSITQTQKANMRNYVKTGCGGFPCVKLAPLYRISNKGTIKIINMLVKKPELLDNSKLLILQNSAVIANSNWNDTIIKRYKNAYGLAKEIKNKLSGQHCAAFETLWREFSVMREPDTFYAELTRAALERLANKTDVALMLKLLFFCKKEQDDKKKNGNKNETNGVISILFDAESLYESGMSVTSRNFTDELNRSLLISEQIKYENDDTAEELDAFGCQYFPSQDVMPEIKICNDFPAKIRTMNKDIYCLHKYKQEGSMTYPVAYSNRLDLQQALKYISDGKNEYKTWICIDKDDNKLRDILFVYPMRLGKVPDNYAKMFGSLDNSEDSVTFLEQAKKYISELRSSRDPNEDSRASNINIFILRRLNVNNNSGRTKVIYTRQTDADELEKCSELWTLGCSNLPEIACGTPRVPYPLMAADILNCFLNQSGDVITDKFKSFPKYHGIELLMDPDLPTAPDLHRLTESGINISPCFGYLSSKKELSKDEKVKKDKLKNNVKDILAMLGLFLYREHIGKEQYMEKLPYLYGQLLKAADELHALYCKVVRNGDIPPQLVGSGMFQSASEMPARTMQVLSQRMMPYYSWAKSYRLKKDDAHEKERKKAGWLYSTCEKIMNKLRDSWTAQTRFTDEEKAQLFIGYLASFPEKDNNNEQTEHNIEEETENE